MDVVKVPRVDPLVVEVVYFELNVRRDAGSRCQLYRQNGLRNAQLWLRGRQIEAEDVRVGVLVAKVDAPDASAGPDVEHASALPLGIIRRRESQPVFEGEEEQVVLQV